MSDLENKNIIKKIKDILGEQDPQVMSINYKY